MATVNSATAAKIDAPEASTSLARRVRGVAEGLCIEEKEGDGSITVSIGIVMVTDPSIAPDSVIREADAAMYRAKELGRSRYELFDEAARKRAEERIELESALSHAVERSELRVHYQPRISLNGNPGVLGFEALVRWEHPVRGLIAPCSSPRVREP